MSLPIHLILACTPRGELGYQNTIPWRLKDDLKRFKEKTMGHFVVVGRSTFESLPGTLEGRTLVVVSKTLQEDIIAGKVTPASNMIVQPTLELALSAIEWQLSASERETKKIFIAGGVRLYEEAWNMASYLHLSLVFEDPKDGAYDTELPQVSTWGWELVAQPIPYKKPGSDEYSYIYYEAARPIPGSIRRPYMGEASRIFNVMSELVGLTNDQLMIEQFNAQEAINKLAAKVRQRVTDDALAKILEAEADPNRDFFNIWTSGSATPEKKD
jgi:dihydrofolate reductase